MEKSGHERRLPRDVSGGREKDFPGDPNDSLAVPASRIGGKMLLKLGRGFGSNDGEVTPFQLENIRAFSAENAGSLPLLGGGSNASKDHSGKGVTNGYLNRHPWASRNITIVVSRVARAPR